MLYKDRLIHVYLLLYLVMVGMVSFTAFYSPFMAKNYTSFIAINSGILFASSVYIIGFKAIKAYFSKMRREANLRAKYRKEVKSSLKKQYGQ